MTSARRTDPEARRLALADLARSGLDLKCLAPGAGFRALSRAEARALDPACPWWRSAPEGLRSLLCEYTDLDGKPTGIWRLRRLEDPPTGTFAALARLDRYHQRAGTRPGVWLSMSVRWRDALRDRREVAFVEGEKKAEALCRAGVPAIGLGGVWNTGSRRQRITIVPELLTIEWAGRPVVILFDVDPKPKTRAHVALAAERLAELVRSQGAGPIRLANLGEVTT
jgi:hypothetical protein